MIPYLVHVSSLIETVFFIPHQFSFRPSRLRENLLKLADTMKASGGWRLEDRFETWAHAQKWRQIMPKHGFEFPSCTYKHILLHMFLYNMFLSLKLKLRFTLPKARSLDGHTVTIAVMLPHEILASLFQSGYIDKWDQRKSRLTRDSEQQQKIITICIPIILITCTNRRTKELKSFWRCHKDLASDIRSSWTSVPWLKLERVMRLIFVVGHFSQTN